MRHYTLPSGMRVVLDRRGNGLMYGTVDRCLTVVIVHKTDVRWYIAIGPPFSWGLSVAKPIQHFSLGLIAFGWRSP